MSYNCAICGHDSDNHDIDGTCEICGRDCDFENS